MMSKTHLFIVVVILGLALPACGLISPPEPTPTFTPEPTPTNTPEGPAELPDFTLTGPPEWEQFTTSEFSIWLPPNWRGGDSGFDVEELMDDIIEEIPEFAEFSQQIQANPDMFIFWGIDLESSPGYLTNFSIAQESLPNFVTVQDYIDLTLGQLPDVMTIIETNTYMKRDYQAGEIILDWEVFEREIQQILFLLRTESSMYLLTFATGSAEFDQRIPVFRQIFEYFEVATGP
jgi:hypothetical protein